MSIGRHCSMIPFPHGEPQRFKPTVICICVAVGILVTVLLIKMIMYYTNQTSEDYQCEGVRSVREMQGALLILYGPLQPHLRWMSPQFRDRQRFIRREPCTFSDVERSVVVRGCERRGRVWNFICVRTLVRLALPYAQL